jgi:hypothetical protein
MPVEVRLLKVVQLEGFSKLFTQRLLRCLELDDSTLRARELRSHLLAGRAFRRGQGE